MDATKKQQIRSNFLFTSRVKLILGKIEAFKNNPLNEALANVDEDIKALKNEEFKQVLSNFNEVDKELFEAHELMGKLEAMLYTHSYIF